MASILGRCVALRGLIFGGLLFFSINAHPQDLFPEGANLPLGQALSLAPDPLKIEIPDFGSIDLHLIATGIGLSQSNPAPGDFNSFVDLSNAQIILQKESGLIQFYLQSGYYSTPSLGTTYQRASMQTMDSFGLVPLVAISIAPTRNWLFTGGKINSFGGFENTFTYQNSNIERGLLWNQTSNVSRGFQVSYKEGGLSTAVTLNDGFYSNQLSWMGASANYEFNENQSAGFIWTGSIKSNTTNTFITPVLQNNSQIFNALYTYANGPWSVAPYLQYTYVPSNPSLGILSSAQTSGAAVLVKRRISGDKTSSITLPMRLEYITSAGGVNQNSPNLLYGAGSAAWSATVTPTYQYKSVFVRAELSYVQTINPGPGLAFGSSGNAKNQTRAVIETGILY